MSYPRPMLALHVGTPDGTAYPQTVHDLGVLHTRSGKVEASDPYVSLSEGFVVPVPPGSYPVRVTIADVSPEADGSHLREAYLSIVLHDDVPVAEIRSVAPEGREPAGPDEYYGVGVDAGTVAFADAEAVVRCMPPRHDDWYNELFDGDETSWFAQQDDPAHLRSGCANIVLPRATDGENVVLAHSGWGDGFYPLATTHAADGTLLGVHLDLLVAEPVHWNEATAAKDEDARA